MIVLFHSMQLGDRISLRTAICIFSFSIHQQNFTKLCPENRPFILLFICLKSFSFSRTHVCCIISDFSHLKLANRLCQGTSCSLLSCFLTLIIIIFSPCKSKFTYSRCSLLEKEGKGKWEKKKNTKKITTVNSCQRSCQCQNFKMSFSELKTIKDV